MTPLPRLATAAYLGLAVLAALVVYPWLALRAVVRWLMEPVPIR